jgi:hypothetical protein
MPLDTAGFLVSPFYVYGNPVIVQENLQIGHYKMAQLFHEACDEQTEAKPTRNERRYLAE